MNKKQKENVFACFFSYNNNAIAWTSFDVKDIIYLQAIWKVHEGLSGPMKIEFISKNVGIYTEVFTTLTFLMKLKDATTALLARSDE